MSLAEAVREPGEIQLQTSRLIMVVPTYQEVDNIDRLVQRIEAVHELTPFDILIVDDGSPDGTGERIQELQATRDWLHLLSRPAPAGLGSAYRDGFRWALEQGYDRVGEMDADLSHDPGSIPSLLTAVEGGASLAVGSRYVAGGGTEGWPWSRRALSRAANLFARAVVGLPVHDATAGFRVYDREAARLVSETATYSDGYGFQVEAAHAVSRSGGRVAEVPITFTDRQFGSSKMSLSTAFEAARCCLRLGLADATAGMREARPMRLALFLVIGLSGVLVNQFVLWRATEGLGLYYVLSAIIATQASTIWNFLLVERCVFDAARGGRAKRFAAFAGMNNVWLAARVPLLVLLTAGLGMHYLFSNLLLLFASTMVRFAVSDTWIWSDATRRRRTWLYDVHGLVRIRSEGRLPELEYFSVDSLPSEADISIAIRTRGFGWPRLRPSVRQEGAAVEYVEHLGNLGFAMRVVTGERVDIVVSRLVSWSPHVLYTNVVEPVLRWHLVRGGRILAHAACLELDGVGVLVTARTDTGKTTTCLKSIRAHGSAFLGDDMVILDADGNALSYPKPLTISAHTLNAVRAAPLSFRRRALLQIQSRLHSREGRALGMVIAGLNLPIATMNAITQMLVPPPKYFVQQLIPDARTVNATMIHRLLVIERGDELSEELDHEAACAVLAENTEDAYGFPPYPSVGEALKNGEAGLEALIRREFLASISSVRMVTPDREWFKRLPELVDGAVEGPRVVSIPAAAAALS